MRYIASLLLSLYRYQEEKRDRRGKRRNKHKKADSGSGGGDYIEQLKRRVDRLEERKLVIENELSKRGEKL